MLDLRGDHCRACDLVHHLSPGRLPTARSDPLKRRASRWSACSLPVHSSAYAHDLVQEPSTFCRCSTLCLSYRVSDVSQSDAIPQHPRHVLLPPNCEAVLMELCFYSASNVVSTRWDPTQPFNSPVSSHSSSNRKFKYGT